MLDENVTDALEKAELVCAECDAVSDIIAADDTVNVELAPLDDTGLPETVGRMVETSVEAADEVDNTVALSRGNDDKLFMDINVSLGDNVCERVERGLLEAMDNVAVLEAELRPDAADERVGAPVALDFPDTDLVGTEIALALEIRDDIEVTLTLAVLSALSDATDADGVCVLAEDAVGHAEGVKCAEKLRVEDALTDEIAELVLRPENDTSADTDATNETVDRGDSEKDASADFVFMSEVDGFDDSVEDTESERDWRDDGVRDTDAEIDNDSLGDLEMDDDALALQLPFVELLAVAVERRSELEERIDAETVRERETDATGTPVLEVVELGDCT